MWVIPPQSLHSLGGCFAGMLTSGSSMPRHTATPTGNSPVQHQLHLNVKTNCMANMQEPPMAHTYRPPNWNSAWQPLGVLWAARVVPLLSCSHYMAHRLVDTGGPEKLVEKANLLFGSLLAELAQRLLELREHNRTLKQQRQAPEKVVLSVMSTVRHCRDPRTDVYAFSDQPHTMQRMGAAGVICFYALGCLSHHQHMASGRYIQVYKRCWRVVACGCAYHRC